MLQAETMSSMPNHPMQQKLENLTLTKNRLKRFWFIHNDSKTISVWRFNSRFRQMYIYIYKWMDKNNSKLKILYNYKSLNTIYIWQHYMLHIPVYHQRKYPSPPNRSNNQTKTRATQKTKTESERAYLLEKGGYFLKSFVWLLGFFLSGQERSILVNNTIMQQLEQVTNTHTHIQQQCHHAS